MYGRNLSREVISTVADLENTFTGSNEGYTAKANTTISVVNDQLKVEKNSGNHIFGTDKTFTITQNATDYMIDFDITLVSGLGTDVLCKLGSTTVATITSSGTYNNISLGNLSSGQYTLTFVTNTSVGGNGKYFTIDDVKVYYEETTPLQSIAEYKYGFNGQERDNEVSGKGNSYTAEFWQYDPRLGRRWNIDPVDKPWISSYHSFSNKPIKNIDPNGANDAPIYDTEGNFLGTDDEGLTGKAIVMNKSDFTQGMSHKDALSKNLGPKGLTSESAKEKLLSHKSGLKNRPDYDGFVSIDEGIEWAKKHPNTLPDNITPDNSLYLNASKLNFGSLSVENIGLQEGEKGNVNLFNYVNFASSSSRATTYALGNTQILLQNAKTGEVKLFYDDYDWDFHNYPLGLKLTGRPPESTRDKLILIERQRAGLNDSHGFRVFIYGIGNIKTK